MSETSELFFRVFFFRVSIFSNGSKWKSRKRKSRKKISKVSDVSEVSEFSTWPKFLNSWIVRWKFAKFLIPFLELRVSFSLNLASLFSARKHNSVFFHLILYALDRSKDPIKVQIFRLSTVCMKINQIPYYVIFQATRQFSFKICITLQCVMTHNSSEIF